MSELIKKTAAELAAAMAAGEFSAAEVTQAHLDRIGAVDEHGTVIYGDQLMIIYGREILSRKPGATFIGEVKCSQLMYDDLAARGGNSGGDDCRSDMALIRARSRWRLVSAR